MRLGLISDVHANLPALRVAVDKLRSENVDRWLCAGDIVGYGPQPNECIELLADLDALCVAGNHDLMLLGDIPRERAGEAAQHSLSWTEEVLRADARSYLADLPRIACVPGLVMSHGSLDDPEEYVHTGAQAAHQLARARARHPDADVVVLGHTHRSLLYGAESGALVRSHWLPRGAVALPAGERVLLNPGSVGQSRNLERRPHVRFALLDLRRGEARMYAEPYDVDSTARVSRAVGLPTASLHRRPRPLRRIVRSVTRPSTAAAPCNGSTHRPDLESARPGHHDRGAPVIGSELSAHQFGPRVGELGGGGMASVLVTYAELPLERYQVRLTATASLYSRFKSFEYVPVALAALLRAALRRPRPVVHVHLAEGGSLHREGGLLRLARRLGLPTVATLHSSQLEKQVREGVDHALLRTVLNAAHVVHALGSTTAGLMRDILGPTIDVDVLPNFVVVRPEPEPAGERPPRVLFAGEISMRKGVDVLLAAWPLVRTAVPEAELLLLGKHRDVAVPEMVGVRWGGGVPREQVLAELDVCRVAVLPARSEAQPMFILEAMAAARPVVTTPIAEIPSTIADHEGLVPVEDVEALAATLVAYLTDDARATSSGRSGRARVQSGYSTTAMASHVETMYDKAVLLASAADAPRRIARRAGA